MCKNNDVISYTYLCVTSGGKYFVLLLRIALNIKLSENNSFVEYDLLSLFDVQEEDYPLNDDETRVARSLYPRPKYYPRTFYKWTIPPRVSAAKL